jgi:serine/threonine protein kinase
MPRVLHTKRGTEVTIPDLSLHSGGEGSIYAIRYNNAIYAAKLYHPGKDLDYFEKKIGFMIDNSPLVNAPIEYQNAIVWPVERLYYGNRFVGYLMPFVTEGKKLYSLSKWQARGPLMADPVWSKYDFSSSSALMNRLKLCYNLANVFSILHKTKRYVLVDAKSENVIVNASGHLRVVDIDSIQIAGGGNQRFRASAQTPENSPPEYHLNHINVDIDTIPQSWDYFSYGIMAYELLCGIHPFQASHSDPNISTISLSIKHGAFVHGKNCGDLYVIPSPHYTFAKLPVRVRSLFKQCFDNGYDHPELRPSFDDWSKVLYTEICALEQDRAMKYFLRWLVLNSEVCKPAPAPSPAVQVPNRTQPKSSNHRRTLVLGILLIIAGVFLAVFAWERIYSTGSKQTTTGVGYEVPPNLEGVYYGVLRMSDGLEQRIYLKISEPGLMKDSYKVSLKYDISKDSMDDILYLDVRTQTVSLSTLGAGKISYKPNGIMVLRSTDENPVLWELERL